MENVIEKLPIILQNLGLKGTTPEYLSKGSFNAVFGFELLKLGESSSPRQYVVRIAYLISGEDDYDEDGSFNTSFQKAMDEHCQNALNTASILGYVRQHIPNTPEELHVDATTDNILGLPYTIQSLVPGKPLHKVWNQLGLLAKLRVAELVADFNLKAELIIFPICGHLQGMKGQQDAELYIQDLSQRQMHFVKAAEHEAVSLGEQCNRVLQTYRPEDNEGLHEDFIAREDSLIAQLSHMLKQMLCEPRFREYLDADINIAHFKHDDLHLGNILVWSPLDKTGVELYESGVIDFDAGKALLELSSRAPPAFLWTKDSFNDEDYCLAWDGDFIHTPREFRDLFKEPHGKDIKEHHDRYVMEKLRQERGVKAAEAWWAQTYGNGMWVRRLADLCLFGLGELSRVEAAEELIEEWKESTEPEPPVIPSVETLRAIKQIEA